jgi:hypothetical protein
MASSGMLCRVALVRTDVLEKTSASILRVTRNVSRYLAIEARCEEISVPKRRFLQEPHGVTSQKMAFFALPVI